jgi:exodeoxyribonuclease V beta subunit
VSVLRYPRPLVLDELRDAEGKLRRTLVTEASAGTGKTYTLEHAVVELILGEVPVEKLLVVTFTERATYEMRERIRGLLGRIARGQLPLNHEEATRFWDIGPRERALLERAYLAFDQAPILTIHGFCQRVLTENAFLAGRLFEQELVDSRTAFDRGFKKALRRDLATDPLRRADLAAWLEEHSVEKLAKLLHDVDRQRAEVRPRLDLPAIQASFDRLRDGVQKGSLDEVRAAVEGAKLGNRKAAVLTRLDQLVALLDDPVATGSVVGLHTAEALDGKHLGYLLAPETRAAIEEKVPRIKKLLALLDSISQSLVTLEAAAAQVFLPIVRAHVAREKQTAGLYDFHDMLELVGNALREGPQRALLVERLRQRYAHALIDEFQDTDSVQWGIFEDIFASSPAHGLWVIADPKQAIYGFRGADVFAYLSARRRLLGADGKPIQLVENFRSTSVLIEAYNRIFDQAARPPFFRGRIRYDAPVRAGKADLVAQDAQGRAVAPIHIFDLVSPDAPLRVEQVRQVLGRRIAREIRRILDEGLFFGKKDELERVPPSEIFVLTRSTREGEQLARYLAEQRVPYAFYKQDGLFQTEEADDIYRILAAIDDPQDRSRRTRAWVTPFFGLTLEQVAGGEPPPDHPYYRRLLGWQRLAERHAFERLFASLVEDTGLLRREIFFAPSERKLTNYLHILEVLHETVGRSRLDLRELCALLRSWIDEERSPAGEDGNVQRLESDEDAVQIMTLHKSKGLEAAVVFLFGGFTDPKSRDLHLYHEPGEGPQEELTPEEEEKAQLQTVVYHDEEGRRVVHVGPLRNEIAHLVREEGADEERRLLYVAITRAKARVYLPAFGRHVVTDEEGNETPEWDFPYLGGCMVHLAERLDVLVHRTEPPPGFQSERLDLEAAAARSTSSSGTGRPSPWTPPAELLTISELPAIETRCSALLTEHAPLVVTSYSRMKESFAPSALEIEAEVLGEEPTPEAPETAIVEPAATDEDPRGGARTGTFLHEVLEKLSFDTIAASSGFDAWRAREDVRRLFRVTMGHHEIAPRFMVGSQRLVHRALTTSVRLHQSTLSAGLGSCTRELRELEFTYPIPENAHLTLPPGTPLEVERGFIRGFIDFVFEHEGRTYLLDWKSDTLAEYGAEAMKARIDESYRLQLEVYTLALARMLGLSNADDHAERFGGVLYVFLRGVGDGERGIHFERPSWDDVKAFEANLVAFDYRGAAP